jgi:hypothetical protein
MPGWDSRRGRLPDFSPKWDAWARDGAENAGIYASAARFSCASAMAPILLLLPPSTDCRGLQMPRACRKKNESLSALQDTELMAVVLEGRHGVFAAEVADFFALLHRQLGDTGRSKAWGGVARTVRRREHDRVLSSEMLC